MINKHCITVSNISIIDLKIKLNILISESLQIIMEIYIIIYISCGVCWNNYKNFCFYIFYVFL